MKLSKVNINIFVFPGIVLILSFLPGILHLLNYLPNTLFVHVELHTFMESVGAIFCVLITVLIYNRFKQNKEELDYPFIGVSFLNMGLFDMYHALTNSGDTFVFSHIVSVFFGGLWFGVIMLPDSFKRAIRKPVVFKMVFLVWLLLVAYMTIWPEYIPVMQVNGHFTKLTNIINLLAFIGFTLGIIKLLLRYKKTFEREIFFFALIGLIQGMSRLNFSFSHLWHTEWWIWHLYRFAGSGILFYMVLRTFNLLIKENAHIIKNQQTIIDAMPFGVMVIGMDKKIRHLNKEAEKLTGYTLRDIKGEYCYNNICLSDCDSCPIIDLGLEVSNDKKEIGMKNKGHLPVIKSVVPIELSNENVLLESFVDITELRNTEARLTETMRWLEESNQELEELTYAASHDLQEPLRKINNYIDIIIKENPFPKGSQSLKKFNALKKNALHQRKLILDLQEITQLSRNSLRISDIKINKLVETIFRTSFPTIHYTLSKFPTIEGDERMLTNLFYQLFSNAQKFNNKERVEITITFKELPAFWEICVKDNGIGFEQEYETKIFTVFEKLHQGAKYPGTGTGLTLCKKIVRLHGGNIWTKSIPGHGTSFFFTVRKLS